MLDLDKTVLLITGCIVPEADVFKLSVSDKNNRLEQYKETIDWALDSTEFRNIVFCDNSNYDASEECENAKAHAKAAHKQMEWITFQGSTDIIRKQGKGYGEGEIIDYVINNSKLLQGAAYFCKITGRLRIDNINQFINMANREQTYFWTIGLNAGSHIVKGIETRFYAAPLTQYIKCFRYSYKEVNDPKKIWLENCFYNSYTKSEIQSHGIFFYPDFFGISGSMGKQYKLSKRILMGKTIASGLGFYCPN